MAERHARKATPRSGASSTPVAPGLVTLVGAGPGDPGLLTIRGAAALRAADAVVYDRLVSPRLLELAPPRAERYYVGKAPRAHTLTQTQINELLIELARRGLAVVRLKGGDPFLFGRGAEEIEALVAAGVRCEVVPGVSSALAGPAVAGIPVTHRDAAASVAVATAHEAKGGAGERLDWEALARADTVVLMMGVERLDRSARALIAAGKPKETPAAVVQDATMPSQRTVVATLAELPAAARDAGIRSPAVVVVGDVVSMRAVVGGWDERPLSGVRVLVTRSREQASELSSVLAELGAETLEAPAIRIEPPRSDAPMQRAVAALAAGRYDWLVLTSANGVRSLLRALAASELDARALAGVRIAAIGTGTADALAGAGLRADLVPATFTTESVGEAFPRGSGRVLLMRADAADPGLEDVLRDKGWEVARVTAYRLLGVTSMPAPVRRALAGGEVDVITFASAGTVRSFMKLAGATVPEGADIVCIGPVTAKAAREAGLHVAAVAEDHTIQGLAAAVVDVAAARRAAR